MTDFKKSIVLPLEQFGINASPFIVLTKDSDQLILLAKDEGFSRNFAPLEEHRQETEKYDNEKDRHIHTLLDESSDPIFSFREDGTYLYVNNCFANTLGYKKEDIIYRKIWDIFPKEEADKRFAMVRKVFLTGKTDTIEVKIPFPDGDVYFLTTVKPIKNDAGSVDFIICISKDITELRVAEDQIKALKGILPICSTCKRIRDNEGSWNQLESYIGKHSEAQFSHGICPDCVKQHYPDIASGLLGK
ncbi:MAG: PAS domain-containing protein [Desulforhopalus sp.]